MSVVSIDLFKSQLNLHGVPVLDDETENMQQMLDAAEDYVVRATHRTAEELQTIATGDTDTDVTYPQPIVRAILLLASHWYRVRETADTAQSHVVPYTVESIVRMYRKLSE